METAHEAEAPEVGGLVIPKEVQSLIEQHDMHFAQENGQRCLGPPKNWEGPPPPKGCEVFVGKLPRDTFESEIFPLFFNIGPIYELRLMMDFSGTNRGYCFVQYTNREDAQKAIGDLNDYEIRNGRRIGVKKSVDNCRLFIGGLPKDKTEAEIYEEISRITEGVRKVIAYPSPQDKSKNRGFAFVEYNCHKIAAMARRKMIPGNILMWDQDVCVDWAEPESEVDPAIMNKVTNLYVRNLMLETTEETLTSLFNEHSNNSVEKVKKIKDYAFVHFSSRETADDARLALDKTEIDGSIIEIFWAKPVERSHNNAKSRGLRPRSRDQASPPSRSSPDAPSRSSPRDQPRYANGQTPQSPFQYPVYPPAPMVPAPNAPPQFVFGSFMPSTMPYPGLSLKQQQPTRLSPYQILAQLCHLHGLGEPIYIHMSMAGYDEANANNVFHNCRVQISQDPSGYRAFRNDGFYSTMEEAKNHAAEGMIRILQEELAHAPLSMHIPFILQPGVPPTPFAN